MGNLGSLFQILIFVVVILGPTIGTIARKVKAHSEEKRIEAERQKRRIEAIRTGQVSGKVTGITAAPNGPQPVAQSSKAAASTAAEAARKQRQEQIAELRRRYQAQQQAQQRARQQAQQRAQQAGQPPKRSPAPVRQPSGQSTGQSKGRAVAAQREAELAARRDELRRRRNEIATQQGDGRNAPALAKPKTQSRASTAKAQPAPTRKHTPAVIPTGHHATRATGLAASLRHPSELRRAIILSEILAPPVAMRPPADR